MNLNDILHDPVSELSDELRDIENKMQRAARLGDIETLNALSQRKKQLPGLVKEAQLKHIADRINDQRTRLGVYAMELKNAREVFHQLSSELPEKLKALEAEKNKLLNEVGQAQSQRDAYEFAHKQETAEFESLRHQREKLLLSLTE